MELMHIPPGQFVMGDPAGASDEQPHRVRIERPFWMGRFEVTNLQYALFQADHDSRYLNRAGKDQSNRGIPMNSPRQPVVRISWKEA